VCSRVCEIAILLPPELDMDARLLVDGDIFAWRSLMNIPPPTASYETVQGGTRRSFASASAKPIRVYI
jgi:hypothetical protein